MFKSLAFLLALVASSAALAGSHDPDRRAVARSIVQHIHATVPQGWDATHGPVIVPAFVADPGAFCAQGCPGVRVGELATWNGTRGGAFSVIFDHLTAGQCRDLLTPGPASLGAVGVSEGDDFTTHTLETPAKVRTFCGRAPALVALIYLWAPPVLPAITPSA